MHERTKPRRPLRALAVTAVSTLVALALAETGLRLFHPIEYRKPLPAERFLSWRDLIHRRSTVPGLAYELEPSIENEQDGRAIRTNSLGMRDDEPVAPRPAVLVRIAIVGDSVAFGLGVEQGATFADELERLLASVAPGERRFEVLNFGVSGYSARDEALVVEHKALPLDPDLVVVAYYLNDPDVEPVQHLHRSFREPALWERFDLLRLCAWKKRLGDMDRLGGGNVYRYLHAESGTNWPSVPRAFADVARATRARDVPVLVVVLPTFFGFATEPPSAPPDGRVVATHWSNWGQYPYRDLHAQVIAAAEREGLRTHDLLDDFTASGKPPEALREDSDHPNAAGHALIAAALRTLILADDALLRR